MLRRAIIALRKLPVGENNVVLVNGREYIKPAEPVAIVCIDGCSVEYITAAVSAGRVPFFSKHIKSEYDVLATMPTFTNPNNVSIITGEAPSVHGISGNYFFDESTKKEVMMNDPKYLRCSTIPSALQKAGCKVALVTAKDKLRKMLAHGLTFNSPSTPRAVCVSAERIHECTTEDNGIDLSELSGIASTNTRVEVYSADVSLAAFAIGTRLMATIRPDFLYISTSDYIQHTHPPKSPVAIDFYAKMDAYLSQLHDMGVIIGITADHGMSDKHDSAGKPQVLYLQTYLDDLIGKDKCRVILPITDPYVVHHGALGSFASVYVDSDVDANKLIYNLEGLTGVEEVLDRATASFIYMLPADRIGTITLVATENFVFGTAKDRHDLTQLTAPLRSHGGLSEARVPMLFNRQCYIDDIELQPKNNYDIVSVALNGAQSFNK